MADSHSVRAHAFGVRTAGTRHKTEKAPNIRRPQPMAITGGYI